MNPRLIPRPYVSPRVSQRTRLWWQDIGRSLMAFTEVEILALDWAVILSDEKSWWLSHSSKDLKARTPLLRKAVKRAGGHALPADLVARLEAVLTDLEALTDLRNELAHMRLHYGLVPTGDGDDWIPDASHVEVVSVQRGGKPVAEYHDRAWIRSVAERARHVSADLHATMLEVRELLLPRRRK